MKKTRWKRTNPTVQQRETLSGKQNTNHKRGDTREIPGEANRCSLARFSLCSKKRQTVACSPVEITRLPAWWPDWPQMQDCFGFGRSKLELKQAGPEQASMTMKPAIPTLRRESLSQITGLLGPQNCNGIRCHDIAKVRLKHPEVRHNVDRQYSIKTVQGSRPDTYLLDQPENWYPTAR